MEQLSLACATRALSTVSLPVNMAGRVLLRLGAVSGALAVVFGAFGAHGLKSRITNESRLQAWATAAHYQLAHSLAICVCGLLPRPASTAGNLFLGGVTLFSGSIYALVLLDKPVLGAITPIGGSLLIAGWVALALAA
eukprot:m.243434 g.243434  ORF g.243434 m.243434 type:complete len:138 (-) comp19020_c3_seq5:166-579(-)